MKKFLLYSFLLMLIAAGGLKAQCPPNALAYTSEYPQCAEGCGVLLRDWPEGSLIYIYGGAPLTVVGSVQIPGLFGGPGVGNAFVCVPCNVPLVFASTVPGATSGCVIVYLGVLPVSLTAFNATTGNGNMPRINWTAATDTRNVVYTLQRSQGEAGFADIYSVSGRGGNSQSYQFTDATAGAGNIRYRLKFRDGDGSVNYSAVVTVKNGISTAPGNVYPNPTGKSFTIRIAQESLPATAQLINSLGQVMETRNINNPITEFGNNLGKGVYALRLTGKNHNSHTQILVKE